MKQTVSIFSASSSAGRKRCLCNHHHNQYTEYSHYSTKLPITVQYPGPQAPTVLSVLQIHVNVS